MLPSEKYKKDLLSIKQEIMKEIVSYFENGEFYITKEVVIHYPIDFGETFHCRFDTVSGYETDFKLFRKEKDFMTQIKFESNEDVNVEEDVPFLLTLLDYIDIDYRNTHHGKRPNDK